MTSSWMAIRNTQRRKAAEGVTYGGNFSFEVASDILQYDVEDIVCHLAR